MKFDVTFNDSKFDVSLHSDAVNSSVTFKAIDEPFIVESGYQIIDVGFKENEFNSDIYFDYSNGVGSKAELYDGSYEVRPDDEPQIINTKNKYLINNIVVYDIQSDSLTVEPQIVEQDIYPDDGKYFNKVTVGAIPSEYTGDIIKNDKLLVGYTAYDNSGKQIAGTMPNRGGVTGSIHTVDSQYQILAGYHNGAGSVAIAESEKLKIIPENIKFGINILGVDGSYKQKEISTEEIVIEPTVNDIEVIPNDGTFFDKVIVALSNADKAALDPNNILKGVSILGVDGAYEVKTQQRKITPNYTTQNITPDLGKFFEKITVDPIPFDLRRDTVSSDKMLSGVTAHDYLGRQITGTIENLGSINDSISLKNDIVSRTGGYYDSVNVAISDAEKTKIISDNIKSGVTILGVTGSYGGEEVSSQEKTVQPGYDSIVVLPDAGMLLSKVTIDPIPFDLREDTVSPETMLNGTSAHDSTGNVIYGSIIVRDGASEEITTKNQVVSMPSGYYSSGSSVSISVTESGKISPANIKSGVTILGVEGSYSGEPVYTQEKNITPTKGGFTVTPDEGLYINKINVGAIPYKITQNSSGGTTFTIAG